MIPSHGQENLAILSLSMHYVVVYKEWCDKRKQTSFPMISLHLNIEKLQISRFAEV